MAYSPTTQTSPSSSSSSLPLWDVFLSFHGVDTRKSFTAHLYTALKQISLSTFRDDEELERGKYISQELLNAIGNSMYAVVSQLSIFLVLYAFSRWCLTELAEIIECMKRTRLIILPVFYHVDPSHVRNQKGTFAEAFDKHGNDPRIDVDDLQTWRSALNQMSYLLLSTQRRNVAVEFWKEKESRKSGEDESMVIQEIVGKIHDGKFRKLNSIVSVVSKKLVGIGSRVEEMMNSYLNIGPDDVRFVGILGMGGIGKTTLARAVYDRISSQFEASSFIANVREESARGGLVPLQTQLLSDILMKSNIVIRDIERGSNAIFQGLCCKKVLVVLDDVDQTQQLEALANRRNWFGGGSIIIITTRDEDVLIKRGLAEDEIYRAKKLDEVEALQLFSWKAFENDLPLRGFMELSKQIIQYANGLPLALEVLGPSLSCRKNVEFWKSTLSSLRKNPKKEIVDTLKISFDGLQENEKNIFLDIACYFKGEKYVDRVKSILESCDYHPSSGKEILISKSLITIMGGKLWMHDLLQEMGHEIIRRQSQGDLGRQSRLWLTNDIIRVLKNSSGTNRIEGMVQNSPPQEDLHLNSDVFSEMKNLRLLTIIGNAHLSQGLSYLSTELRVIQWHGYPLTSLPRPPNKLVELTMCCSHIVELWKGIERLILQGCTKLRNLHSSVGALKCLIFLNLEGCKSLTSLPCNISWDSLEILNLSGCTRLRKFPETIGNMNCLRQLDLDGIALVELPSSIGHLIGLTTLSLKGCKSLLSLPSAICGNLEHLEELDMNETAIRQFPSSITRLRNLKMLSFRGSSGPPKSFLRLFVTCLLGNPDTGLVLPPSFSSTLWSLNKLNLSYCHLMDGAIPDDLSGLSSLIAVDLSGNDFTFLPESISQLPKLSFIFLSHCSKLRSIQELPSRIVYVEAEDCISLETRSDEMHTLLSDETGFTFLHGTHKPSRLKEGQLEYRQLNERRTIQAHIDLANVMWGGSRGGGIPTWFQNQSMGSSITIRLHPNLDDGRKWLGFALYFFYEIHDLESWESTRFTRLDCKELEFHFVTDEGPLKAPLSYGHKFSNTIDTPAGHWIFLPRNWLEKISNEVDTWSYITVSIAIGSPFMKVEKCGAHLIYEQNAHEFIDAVLSPKKMTLKICDGKGNFKFQSSPRSSYPVIRGASRFSLLGVSRPKNVGEVESSGSNLLDKGFNSNEMLECTSKNSISTYSAGHPGCNIIDSDSTIRLKKYLQSLLLRCYEVNYAQRNMHKYAFPLSASPLWFTVHGMRPVVCLHLPPNLYDDKEWVGFAISVSYVIRDQTSVSGNIFGHLDAYGDDLECFFVFPPTPDTIVAGPSRIFLFHLPRVFFTDKLNQQSKIRAAFGTDDQNMEVVMCGIRLVYKKDLIGLVHTIVDCVLRSPEIHRQIYLRSFENQDTEINKFHPYNNCFLQCEIPDYFCCHVSSSVAFHLPLNLNNNSDWIGIALCVVFTINKNNEPLIRDNPAGSKICHTLLCHLTSNTGLEMLISHGITIRSGNNSFSWLSYIPREASFSESLNECDHIHALFYSNSQDLIGNKCGHKLVDLDNMAELVGTIAQCAATSPHNSGLINHQFEGDDQDRSNKQCRIDDQKETGKSDSSNDEISRGTTIKGKSGSRIGKLNQKRRKCIKFLHNPRKEFHFFFASDHCFPPSEIPEFLTYRAIGPSVTMELPTNMHNDSEWDGLLICASFTFQENQIEFLESLESEIPHHLICFFDTDIHSLRPIHVYRTAKQEFKWLHLNGFIWLYYIPIWWLPNGIQCCNHLEVSIISDWPGLIVNNCGLRFLSRQDSADFMQLLLPFQVFHRNFEYSSCFLPCGITEWFNYHSNEPSVGFELPPDFYNDNNWLGLAICASFWVYEDDKAAHDKMLDLGNPHYLLCLLDTDIGSVNPDLHSHRPFTEEEIKWVRQGEIMWLLFIPKGSLPGWLNQSTRIEASIASDCPSLRVHKCGFQLLYLHNEAEFKETIRHCNKQNRHKDYETSITRPNFDPTIQDKGKQVVQ
ncbi:hypothetical protein I3760_15G039000 [Carya illinoinensis]|nr:hypothetical protein I3760_15G039000 [Carya illinoinensis]